MLSLSLTTRHALKALRCLAGGTCSTRHIADIAQCADVPRPYLAKVMALLARGGLVVSKRGYRGGIALTRAADQISLLDVIVAIEGEHWMGDCLLGLNDCHAPARCPTATMWTRVRGEIQHELTQFTLADLVECRSQPGANRTRRVGPSDRALSAR